MVNKIKQKKTVKTVYYSCLHKKQSLKYKDLKKHFFNSKFQHTRGDQKMSETTKQHVLKERSNLKSTELSIEERIAILQFLLQRFENGKLKHGFGLNKLQS